MWLLPVQYSSIVQWQGQASGSVQQRSRGSGSIRALQERLSALTVGTVGTGALLVQRSGSVKKLREQL